KNVRLAQDWKELQTRQFVRHLDVGAIMTNALPTLLPHIGPFRTRHEVDVPLRVCSKFRCAIAEERIPSGPNLIREGYNQLPAVLAEPVKMGVVERNIPKLHTKRTQKLPMPALRVPPRASPP